MALLTSVTRGYDRVSIHGVRRELLHAQAAAAGLPLVEIELEPRSSNDAYETAFANALDRLGARFPDAKAIAFGDLFLEDVRAYRERVLSGTGFRPIFPIWGRETRQLAEEFIDAGFLAHLVCVDTEQLAADFAGRQFDRTLLADLPPAVDPCGERGEFHTFVSAGPIFERPTIVGLGEVVLRDDRFAFCDLLPAVAAAAER
jgi:uncharacterized protein (TIGR00290 family)